MNILFGIIIFLALGAIFILLYSLLQKYPGHEKSGLYSLLFAVWLIATGVWSRYFFEIKLPGMPDITFDRVLLFVMILCILAGLYSRRVSFRQSARMECVMLVFSAVCICSMLVHGFQPELPAFPPPWSSFTNGYLYPFIAFIFVKYFFQGKADIQVLFHCLFFFGVYIAITSFFEFFNIRWLVFPRYINNPAIPLHLERARGPFLNAAFNGAALTFGFICGVHILSDKKKIFKAVYSMLLLLYFPAIFFTQTRSSYLGFLISLVFFLFLYRTTFLKWKALALPVALFMVFMLASIPKLAQQERRTGGVLQTEEVEIRMALVERSLAMATINPFFGIGLAQFMPTSAMNFPGETMARNFQEHMQHFHLLGMLVEIGIVGAAVYLAMIILVFRRIYQLRTVLPEQGIISRNLLLALTTVWIVYLATNFFLEPAYCQFFNAAPFACAGIADGLYRRCRMHGIM